MKKWFGLLTLVLLLLVMPVVALALETELPAELLDWTDLGTLGIAAGITVYIVQMLKLPVDKVLGHIPTRIIVYVVAMGILLLAQIFVPGLGGLSWETGLLCIFNAVLVALAAMKTYEVAIENVEEKKAALSEPAESNPSIT